MTTITIPTRFNGPPASANGGYTCGLVASLVEGDAEVTLRSPPPLATPLAVKRDAGKVLVHDGDTLVAEAIATTVDHAVPTAPSWEEAEAAAHAYAGLEHHEFPTCFTCGHERESGDGLRILTGPVGDGAMVASTWIPGSTLPSEDGIVAPEIVWAALDCPGAWTTARIVEGGAVVLGRMAARLDDAVHVGDHLIAYAWPLGSEGRKHHAATALVRRTGGLVGTARQTWIAV